LFRSYNLIFVNYETIDEIINAFINKDIDIATVTLFEALLIQNKSQDRIKIILLLDYTTGSDAIIAQSPIEFLHELKGKVIGIEKNTVSHFTFYRGLEKAHLTNQMVTIKALPKTKLISEFNKKKLDAISLYDPYIFELNEYNKSLNIIFSSKEIPKEICDVVIIRESIIDSHPTLIPNIQHNWFKLTSKQLPYKKLKPPIYNSPDYIQHIHSNIYIANKHENAQAFGPDGNNGYLQNTLKKIQAFLHKTNQIPSNNPNIEDLFFSQR